MSMTSKLREFLFGPPMVLSMILAQIFARLGGYRIDLEEVDKSADTSNR